jgi:hypothetical protein
MELILKSNNKQSMAKILALAEKLNVIIEKKDIDNDENAREAIKNRILNFKSNGALPFGDAVEWQREQRQDGQLHFS